ncbi:unnamed protein product [Peniophora sp. CBMAI 1063]|nr:unnamed protein product [Peniophora sp. CBMAI 1063]
MSTIAALDTNDSSPCCLLATLIKAFSLQSCLERRYPPWYVVFFSPKHRVLNVYKYMPQCFCLFKKCNGADIPRQRKAEHARQDVIRGRRSAAVAQNPVLATSTPTPNPPPAAHFSDALSADPPPLTNDLYGTPELAAQDDNIAPMSTAQSCMASSIAERDRAEEAGEAYVRAMRTSSSAPRPEDDIGDPDADDDDMEDNEPSPSASRPPFPPPLSTPSSAPTSTLVTSAARPTADPRYPGENDPDPFVRTARAQPRRRGQLATGVASKAIHPGVYLLYLLVAWLHAQCKLAFVACDTVLRVVGQIIAAFAPGWSTGQPPVLGSLKSVMENLGVEPDFQVLPTCPFCLEVYPSSRYTSPNAPCDRCHEPVFRSIRSLNRRLRPGARLIVPSLQFPMKSIEDQLRDIIAVPGVEDTLDGWRQLAHIPGEYRRIFDGRIIRSELKAANGRLFFENPLPVQTGVAPELRIGLSMGVDWFSYLRSLISPSHSSGPMSFSIINLPAHLKFRVMNMILVGILPGPKEQDFDQVQRFMRPVVNELLRLWEQGFVMSTKRYPQGRRIRVILVCVVCDKPAAHKLGGFGSHSHTFYCTRCWIKKSDKATAKAFEKGAFAPRTPEEQLEYAKQYASCASQTERDTFVRAYASRWCELARLPYFDVCRMIVVDPMHNLLLGLVKTHFYHIWVKLKVLRKKKELRRFHSILAQLSIPSYLGRVPSLMGEPAGGSLTADQWLIAATLVCPFAIPQIWDEYGEGDAEVIRLRRIGNFKELAEKRKRERAAAKEQAANNVRRSSRKRRRTERAQYREEPDEDEEVRPDAGAVEEEQDIFAEPDDEDEEAIARAPPNLHPDDPANMAKLSRFLRIVLAKSLNDAEINTADTLIREYCTELIYLYGPDVIKPNHHYATDVPDCIRDFGPLHEFWTFLFERINKVLKSYNSANHSGGELEVSFFREFHRTIQLSRELAAASATGNIHVQTSIEAMYKSSADDRGTVQALAREVDEAHADGGVLYELSSRCTQTRMQDTLYLAVLGYLRLRLPSIALQSWLSPADGIPLLPEAMFFDYVVLSSRRFWASSRTNNVGNTLIAVRKEGGYAVGELQAIIGIAQAGVPVQRLGYVNWLVSQDVSIAPTSAWNSSISLGVFFWRFGERSTTSELIVLEDIVSHVVLSEAVVAGRKCWATIMPHSSPS